MVTDSQAAYEDLAVQLATELARLQTLRKICAHSVTAARCLTPPRFVRHLEDALIATATQVRDEATRANPAHFSAPCSAPASAAEPTALPTTPTASQKNDHFPTAQAPRHAEHTRAPPMVLQFQGWRGIHHFHALVNQFQMLAWLDQGLSLVHTDPPLPYADIQQSGLSAKD